MQHYITLLVFYQTELLLIYSFSTHIENVAKVAYDNLTKSNEGGKRTNIFWVNYFFPRVCVCVCVFVSKGKKYIGVEG